MNEEEKAKAEAIKKANEDRNNSRLKLMEQIADSSEDRRRDDIDGLELKDDDAEREARAIREDEEAARLLQTEGVTSDTEPTHESSQPGDEKVINGERHYLTIVNGVEKWMTLKNLREVAQKVESADEYLRTAKESVTNAARLALSQKDEQSNVNKVDVRSVLRAAVLGDDEAIEKLASVFEEIQAKPSAVTPDVLQQIDQRLSFRTELEQLERKSKDLLENPYMARLFRSRLNELKESSPTMGLSEAYSSIDRELRTAFPGFKTKAADKLERKRTLVNPPSAASRQVVEEEPEGEESLVDVIEQMAKARGLSAHVHTRRQ